MVLYGDECFDIHGYDIDHNADDDADDGIDDGTNPDTDDNTDDGWRGNLYTIKAPDCY